MNQLSNAGEYAIRAMLHLAAREGQGVTPISSISDKWDIPESFLRKILNSLSKAQLVLSTRGTGGGFSLARPADNITLLDVVEAIEGKSYFNRCLVSAGACTNDTWCPVHVLWSKAQNAFTEILSSKTLKDLTAQPDFVSHFRKINI